MAKSQRSKGKRGERAAELMLLDRDYTELMRNPCGKDGHDITAKHPVSGKFIAWEIKNRVTWEWSSFMDQSRTNAQKFGYLWGLMCKIPNTKYWLVCIQGESPQVWHE